MSLKYVEGKVIVSVNLQYKNSHTFSDGTTIRLERQFDNLNRRETEPVNAIVVSAKDIPDGSEILIHPNAVADHHEIHNHTKLSGKETASDIKYYSIPEDMCFCYRSKDEWLPLPPYETALRIFIPYKGVILGVEPKKMKDALYCTSGEYKGVALATIKAVDYEVIFQNANGKEGRIIRWRPNGDEKTKKESEAIGILNDVTKKVNKGEYLIGLNPNDAKTISP